MSDCRDCDQAQDDIREFVDQIKSLEQRLTAKETENAQLREALQRFENGYKGSCYACEPVGELNLKLQSRLAAKEAECARLRERLEGHDVMGLAEEQRQLPSPFGGIGTANAYLRDNYPTQQSTTTKGEIQ